MLAQLLNTPCTLILRSASGSTDELGNEIPSETPVDTVCELQQKMRSEGGDEGEVSETDWLIILPAGTQVRTGDAALVGEYEYEMIGDPWHVRNPRIELESHVEITARRVAGSEDVS